MRLSEIMSAAGLQVFAEIGLVLFLAIFAGVVVYTFTRKNRATFDRARSAPLTDAPRASGETSTHE
jgi:cbb3-type cytochrome oxidase subunit 3